MAVEAPPCAWGHVGTRVVRDGQQKRGGRVRQRWRCISSDGSYHRFVGVLGRTRATVETCTECENHVAAHQGPATPSQFEYLVREVAQALVELGAGGTYRDVAQRCRTRANVGKTGTRRDKVVNGQTVAEWLPDFVPVVAASHREEKWPAVLVLDSISFWWRKAGDFGKTQLYSILAAYGYDEDGKNGRLVRLEAKPVLDYLAWCEFFESLPGIPASVVADDDKAIQSAIRAFWGEEFLRDRYHSCEQHMRAHIKNHLGEHGSAALKAQITYALTSPQRWADLQAAADAERGLSGLKRWIAAHKDQVDRQIERRRNIPPVYANGAVETVLRTVRTYFEPRAFTYRNRSRTNLLLELIRLNLNHADSVTGYATAIREHLEAHGGRPHRHYRDIYDAQWSDDGTEAFNSLWSPSAQQRMRANRTPSEAA